MSREDPPTAIVFRSQDRRSARESRLVLEAAGIASSASQDRGEWTLFVAEADEANALREMQAYAKDKSSERPARRITIRTFGGAIAGVIGYVTVLLLIASVSFSPDSHPIWVSIGRMNAGQVMSGQVWRTVTALTLHADAVHLASNLAYGGVFGLLVGRILGGGAGWLAIVVAGAVGNGINALMRNADHSSIGASTAVFAMLGILVAHALRPRASQVQPAMRRWTPLICGVLLLSLTGTGGERTDVGAHGTGFVAGLLIGWCFCRLPEHYLANNRIQWIAAIASSLIVVACWSIAIAMNV